MEVLSAAKRLAREYYELTGRPLGVTGEIAEYEAIRLLGLTPSPARQAGFDAIRPLPRGRSDRIQIKGRCVLPGANRGQRLGRIDLSKDFDSVMMVLLNEHFEATAIFEASREAVATALLEPGSISRNQRGALSIAKFKAIGRPVWPST